MLVLCGFGDYGCVATTYQYTPANFSETNSTKSGSDPSSSNEKQNNPLFTPELIIFLILLTATVISVVAIRWRKKILRKKTDSQEQLTSSLSFRKSHIFSEQTKLKLN